MQLTSFTAKLVVSWLLVGTAAADNWRHYGGDPGGQHYSSASQINRDNVDELEPAWVFRSGDVDRYGDEMSKTSTQSTPILLPAEAGGSLVYCTAFNEVIALHPANGTPRWRFDPAINREGDRPFRCRGVSYSKMSSSKTGDRCQHRIYLATHDRHLWAIDSHTGQACNDFGQQGKIALETKTSWAPGDISNSSPPVVTENLVITGSTVIDFTYSHTPRGTVKAFDKLNGELRWQFDPLQGYPNSGSANVWAPMSVDEQAGLLYLPTSASSPD
jgi:quinoprotein glucose dehydrogenase